MNWLIIPIVIVLVLFFGSLLFDASIELTQWDAEADQDRWRRERDKLEKSQGHD